MITSNITLLLIDNPHAISVHIGIAIRPNPVRLNALERDVVAILTNVSKDFYIAVIVSYFYYLYLDLLFLYLE